MRFYKLVFILILAGCSSVSGVVTTPDADDISLADDLDTDAIIAGAIPTSGSADYLGTLSLTLPDAASAITSPLSLAVDFGGSDAQVTGEAADFTGYEGALYLTRGIIDRDTVEGASEISGSLSGSLKEGDNNHLIFGTFAGDFSGTEQEAISGAVDGSTLLLGTQATFSGTFLAGQVP